jgi:hypothetical protein
LDAPKAGLCESCRHTKVIRSGRGSEFRLCRLSEQDPRFAKYPRLPVLTCAGYAKAEKTP